MQSTVIRRASSPVAFRLVRNSTKTAFMSTALYRRTMAQVERDLDEAAVRQEHQLWDRTPWMVDVFTGPAGGERDQAISAWCRAKFGAEALPLQGRDGSWRRSDETINGWAWFGFDTASALKKFQDAWLARRANTIA
ncbi:hypothetical protein [Thioclava sp. IC9]|uniref:hypothetical protein n=1 Tax=Thioclava sp. IC9 TaxID=1973007 RepID=UPI00113196A6|nr:hypothetical protein [Thioclava sp. IC9]